MHGASETVSSEHDVEDADSSQPTQKKIGKDRNKDKTGKKELSIDHGSVTTCEKFGNKSGKVKASREQKVPCTYGGEKFYDNRSGEEWIQCDNCNSWCHMWSALTERHLMDLCVIFAIR